MRVELSQGSSCLITESTYVQKTTYMYQQVKVSVVPLTRKKWSWIEFCFGRQTWTSCSTCSFDLFIKMQIQMGIIFTINPSHLKASHKRPCWMQQNATKCNNRKVCSLLNATRSTSNICSFARWKGFFFPPLLFIVVLSFWVVKSSEKNWWLPCKIHQLEWTIVLLFSAEGSKQLFTFVASCCIEPRFRIIMTAPRKERFQGMSVSVTFVPLSVHQGHTVPSL